MRKKQTPFSAEEIDEIRQLWPSQGWEACEICLGKGRKPQSICMKAYSLGLHKDEDPAYRKWTEDEDEEIMKYYPIHGVKGCDLCIASGRTLAAIRARAFKLNIPKYASRYSPLEDQDIKDNYQRGGAYACRLCLDSGKTIKSIRNRAIVLGIKLCTTLTS